MKPTRVSIPELSKKLSFRLHALNEDGSDQHSLPTVYRIAVRAIETLETYPMPLLRLIDQFTKDADERILRYMSRMIKANPDRSLFEDTFTYLPLIDNTKYWTAGIIDSIRYYQKEYPWFPKGNTPEEVKAVALFGIASYAIIDSTLEHEDFYEKEALEGPEDAERFNFDRTLQRLHWVVPGDRDRWVLTDERMICMLLERPDADHIVGIVKDRGTLSYDVIHDILDHSETALNSGVL
jgi:hypothetical protein